MHRVRRLSRTRITKHASVNLFGMIADVSLCPEGLNDAWQDLWPTYLLGILMTCGVCVCVWLNLGISVRLGSGVPGASLDAVRFGVLLHGRRGFSVLSTCRATPA